MSLIYKGQTIADVGGGSSGGGGVPKGTIVIWSGAADAVPSGWALCDGQNGTPDLRDRFVVGAGTSYEVGATGGEATHTLMVNEMPAHAHSVPYNSTGNASSIAYMSYSTHAVLTNMTLTTSSGDSQPHNNMPPFYALCYIMKITDGGSDSSEGSSEEIYSTEETRIGTWIDGKPLYRKTYSVSKDYPNAGSDLDVPIAEDIFGSISSVVNVYGAGYARGVIVCVNASNFVISGSAVNTYCFVQGEPTNSRFLLRYRGGNSGTFKADVTLEYTKTTDEAAS